MSPLPRRTPVARPSLRTSLRTLFATTVTTVLTAGVAVAGVALAAPAQAENRVTPGDFTGYGFDQCVTPTQAKMNAWMEYSPFSAVGIYISGKSRACRDQPNLTKNWVSTQLANHWRLLPIALGPQSSCVGRFPRYGASIDPTIRERSTNHYNAARKQGVQEAATAVAAARALGITAGSTLWYDLEGWSNVGDVSCRESALSFLQAWTRKLHRMDYVSGVYSSAGSGMVILDQARINRPAYVLPDRIWIARWDNKANTSTSYISDAGWRPGGRVKQYQGGHDETWGGVKINIDRNYLDLGKGSRRLAPKRFCKGTVNADFSAYHRLKAGTTLTDEVKALQCLLRGRGLYKGKISGTYDANLTGAVRAFQKARGTRVSNTWRSDNWVQLLSTGRSRPAKFGTTGPFVARLQRALVAATGTSQAADGAFFRSTADLVRKWQGQVGLARTGVMSSKAWARLKAGDR